MYIVKRQQLYDLYRMCVLHGSGMHNHVYLSIYIHNNAVIIPGYIGITQTPFCMHPVHTHDPFGIIHLQFPTQTEVKLKEFFSMWGKRFNSNCILDACNGRTGKVSMSVNGKENHDFENYRMHDQDRIEIRFE